MSILDRYIARVFLTNLLIIFVVIMGLYILLDVINYFDEFVQAAQRQEGGRLTQTIETIRIAVDYYWPTAFLVFTYMVGLLPVGAAGFTLAALLRSREITAMLAGGISMYRIALPIFALGFALSVAMAGVQEFVLPPLAKKLARTPPDLRFEGQVKQSALRFVPDTRGNLYSASAYDLQKEQMSLVTILRRQEVHGPDGRTEWSGAIERITADRAVWDGARGGWALETDKRDESGVVVEIEGGTATPRADLSGAEKRQDVKFFPSDLNPETILLRERSKFRQLLSLRQLGDMIDKARRSQVLDVGELMRIRHSRFSMLVMNMLILAMGLPFFLLRAPANLFVQVAKCTVTCVGAWAGGHIMLTLGADTLPITPAAIAWLPVAMYLPVAYWLMDSVET